MFNSSNTDTDTINNAGRVFFWGLMIWILLQISRFIAFALINDVNAGAESPAWMFPAYLDLFAAFLAVPLSVAIWKKPGLITWSLTVIYFSISIVDHVGNFVTTDLVGQPSIVPEGANPELFPAIMTIFDAIFLVLLFIPKYRRHFFELQLREE